VRLSSCFLVVTRRDWPIRLSSDKRRLASHPFLAEKLLKQRYWPPSSSECEASRLLDVREVVDLEGLLGIACEPRRLQPSMNVGRCGLGGVEAHRLAFLFVANNAGSRKPSIRADLNLAPSLDELDHHLVLGFLGIARQGSRLQASMDVGSCG
jgi:hypothetical protein